MHLQQLLWGVLSSAWLCQFALAQEPQRLSQWLRSSEAPTEGYALGLMWTTPEEKQRQQIEFANLNDALSNFSATKNRKADNVSALQKALAVMPPTGRVRVNASNAMWLEANPKRDPVLRVSDQVSIPTRPVAVRVMLSTGSVCDVPHKEGLQAKDYVGACFSSHEFGAWAWQVQPDGRVQKVGVSLWSRSLKNQPAPGAWLWVPAESSELGDEFHLRWAKWLATQGVADAVPLQKFEQFHRQVRPMAEELGWLDIAGRARQDAMPTANNWGGVGLMQTPTARMREAGYFGLGFQHAWPYAQAQIFMQPLDWVEAGFRYVDIANRLYGSESLSGDQTYKDKSIDLKIRVLQEAAYAPSVSVGWRDMGGTGLFSSEYFVANKRTGRLDWSAGVAWGYLGGHARQNDFGQGGNFVASNWFRGKKSSFAGVSYESPWNLVLKAEYEANNYQNEPLGNALKVKSPLNLGLVYRPWKGADVSASFERGDTIAFGLTFYTDISRINTPKLMDPRVPAVRNQRLSAEPNWIQTAADVEQLTQWQIEQMYLVDDTLVVQAAKTQNPYPQVRLDKAMAVLHRDAPVDVNTVEVRHSGLGQVLAVEQVNRAEWVQGQTEPPRTQDVKLPLQPIYPPLDGLKQTEPLLPQRSSNFYLDPGLDFLQNLGGPDGFVMYQFSALVKAGLKLPDNFELRSETRVRLLNNYDRFKYTAPSSLPRVRTYLREYAVTSPVTMSNLALTKSERLSKSVYLGVYGGYFEEMFGGVGAELLYRQPSSRWALGVDVNQVRQRAFEQNFNFRDYKVNTGHVTGYWATPFEGVHTSLSVGQYLARDRGASLSVYKIFANGSMMGAFATKTNVPPEVFGEGSFDKGVFWSIPFDAFLTSSSRSHANFGWKPLTRDGGAKVMRPMSLYAETELTSPLFNSYLPADPANELVAPDDRRERFERR